MDKRTKKEFKKCQQAINHPEIIMRYAVLTKWGLGQMTANKFEVVWPEWNFMSIPVCDKTFGAN